MITGARLTTRLTLLCHAPTRSAREGGFPAREEPLDEGGMRKAAAFRLDGPRPTLVVTSAACAARQTADALRLEAMIQPAILDIDHGEWAGRSLAEIHAAQPDALAAWLGDPTRGTPGGETMADVADRLADWLDGLVDQDRHILAITHAAVIRAAIAHTLGVPIGAALRIDIAPLSLTTLSFTRCWRLQEIRSD